MRLVTALLVLGALCAPAQAGRVFVLADDQGQRHLYAAYREAPWPEADAEAGQFAQIASTLKYDRDLGVLMIAPDRNALQRAVRALAASCGRRRGGWQFAGALDRSRGGCCTGVARTEKVGAARIRTTAERAPDPRLNDVFVSVPVSG
jgi:hypothetical protein